MPKVDTEYSDRNSQAAVKGVVNGDDPVKQMTVANDSHRPTAGMKKIVNAYDQIMGASRFSHK